MPEETIAFTDLHYGPQAQHLPTGCGDFILRRSDGVYAYQLAVVADDGAMGVTQVVRGRDLLSSTPRQILLYRLLGYPVPEFGHTPLLLAGDGRRLSKRAGDQSLSGILSRGYSPRAVSYTHLDVYKRQGMLSRRFFRRLERQWERPGPAQNPPPKGRGF